MYVCLWSPAWSTGGASAADEAALRPDDAVPRPPDLAPSLAALAPRIRVEPEVVWADGRGLDAVALATRLLDRLTELGVEGARAGVAAVPVTAELAARIPAAPASPASPPGEAATRFLVKDRTGWGWRASTAPHPDAAREPRSELRPERKAGEEAGSPHGGAELGRVVVVGKGREASWQAPLPVGAMVRDQRLRSLLEGVGVTTLGRLAGLAREAIEVRFGPEAVDLWRLARADDRRVLFRRVASERPCGSIDFVDYVLTDPARLLFTANALLGPLCERLVARGEHARAMRLVLPLADGSEWERVIRPARPTASRDTWLRLLRDLLERLTVPDAVAGMRLELGRTEPAAVRQGDLFDRGFATAAAVEAAVARLAERQVVPLAPETDAHPLLERRGKWRELQPEALTDRTAPTAHAPPGRGGGGEGRGRSEGAEGPGRSPSGEEGRKGLGLQLLERPRRLLVETVRRRDHEIPIRLRDRGGWREIAHAAGPDRISGGQWEAEPYAREYFRCVTDEGVPLWIYRDGREGTWYLQGWWD